MKKVLGSLLISIVVLILAVEDRNTSVIVFMALWIIILVTVIWAVYERDLGE